MKPDLTGNVLNIYDIAKEMKIMLEMFFKHS